MENDKHSKIGSNCLFGSQNPFYFNLETPEQQVGSFAHAFHEVFILFPDKEG